MHVNFINVIVTVGSRLRSIRNAASNFIFGKDCPLESYWKMRIYALCLVMGIPTLVISAEGKVFNLSLGWTVMATAYVIQGSGGLFVRFVKNMSAIRCVIWGAVVDVSAGCVMLSIALVIWQIGDIDTVPANPYVCAIILAVHTVNMIAGQMICTVWYSMIQEHLVKGDTENRGLLKAFNMSTATVMSISSIVTGVLVMLVIIFQLSVLYLVITATVLQFVTAIGLYFIDLEIAKKIMADD